MAEAPRWYESTATQKFLEITAQALGGLLMVGASTFGLPAGVLGGIAATTAQVAYQRNQINKSEDALLHLYKDKLAVLMHKPEQSLTRADLHKAAAPLEQGGLGITTLQKQVNNTQNFKRIKTYGQLASAALIGGMLIGVAALTPLATLGVTGIGLMGVAATMINKYIGAYTDNKIAHHNESTVTKQIFDITARVKTSPVPPEQVMDVFVRANPELQQSISKRYGDSYMNITMLQKAEVVKEYEPTLHIAALTQEINKGTIKTNTLGFLAYGQSSDVLPDCKRFKDLCASTATNAAALQSGEPAAAPAQHVEKLMAQRNEAPGLPRRTLH